MVLNLVAQIVPTILDLLNRKASSHGGVIIASHCLYFMLSMYLRYTFYNSRLFDYYVPNAIPHAVDGNSYESANVEISYSAY